MAATLTRTGRPQRPYLSSWGEHITGLAYGPDGRWRIVATGERYREADERKAVQKFRQKTGFMRAVTSMEITLGQIVPDAPDYLEDITIHQVDRLSEFYDAAGDALDDSTTYPEGRLFDAPFRLNVPDVILWPWLREMILTRPEFVARMTGIPEIARLTDLPAQRAAVKLSAVWDYYETENGSKKKGGTLRTWNQMVAHTGAKTLADNRNDRCHAIGIKECHCA